MRKYIDENKAKNGIMKFVNEYGKIVGMSVTDFNILLERCAADVEPRWIPVTERLPEEHEEVLTYNPVFGITFDSIHNGKWRKHPVAWMPLPDPYKEGEEE